MQDPAPYSHTIVVVRPSKQVVYAQKCRTVSSLAGWGVYLSWS